MQQNTSPKTSALHEFFKHGQAVQYQKHQTIWHQSNPPALYFVESGFVKAYTITPHGFSNTLLIYAANDVFPLSLLYLNHYQGQFFYKAMSNVRLRQLSRSELITGVNRNAPLAGAIFDRAMASLSVFSYRLQNLQRRSARERVIFCLLHLASRYGVMQDGLVTIGVPLTHQELAEVVNSSRETVSREIERLAREGVLQQKSRTIKLLDQHQMMREIEVEPQLFKTLAATQPV